MSAIQVAPATLAASAGTIGHTRVEGVASQLHVSAAAASEGAAGFTALEQAVSDFVARLVPLLTALASDLQTLSENVGGAGDEFGNADAVNATSLTRLAS